MTAFWIVLIAVGALVLAWLVLVVLAGWLDWASTAATVFDEIGGLAIAFAAGAIVVWLFALFLRLVVLRLLARPLGRRPLLLAGAARFVMDYQLLPGDVVLEDAPTTWVVGIGRARCSY